MSKVSDKILFRVYILVGVIGLFSLLIVWRVIQIQFLQKSKWMAAIEKTRIYEKEVEAARGNILSDEGKVMATSQPYFRLSMDPSLLKRDNFEDFDASLDSLATMLDAQFEDPQFDKDYFKGKVLRGMEEKDKHIYLVPRIVSFDAYNRMRTWPIFNQSRYKGGLIEDPVNFLRNYPYDSLARITLGRLLNDSTPLKGLEFSFHQHLRGERKRLLVQKVDGGEIPLNDYGDISAEDGSDVVTTINVEMQAVAERALARAVNENEARFGVAILMEVATGEIKAIANYPEDLNRAVALLVEPGSTIKLASAISLLEDGLVEPEDTIHTGNGIAKYYDAVIRDDAAYWDISFQQVVEKSSNVGVSKLINEFYAGKEDRFFAHLRRFGLLDPVNQQLVGEPSPIVITPGDDEWSGTNLPSLSIGYGIQMTPLQMLTFYNGFANRGRLVEPMLVRKIVKGTKVIRDFKPRVSEVPFCSPSTWAAAHEMLKGVVARGTARRLKPEGYSIAGKTGTAKKVVNGAYQNIYRASFCGYFPADEPKYSCIVLIDEPSKDKIYGAEVAAPVLKEIADKIYIRDLALSEEYGLDLVPEYAPEASMVSRQNASVVYRNLQIPAEEQAQAEARYIRARRNGSALEFKPVKLSPGKVPDVRGMSSRDAVALLESLGLRVLLKGHGRVKRTEQVQAGERIEPHKTIELILE